MNQYISDIQNNLLKIEKDLIEIKSDTASIKSDLKAINQSTTKAVRDSTWMKILSAVFLGITFVMLGILIYQMLKLHLLLS